MARINDLSQEIVGMLMKELFKEPKLKKGSY
jgi:hypothetical protein